MTLRTLLAAGSCAGLVLIGSGCVMPDQLSQMEKDLADVRQELREIHDDQRAALTRMAELETLANQPQDEAVSRDDLADLSIQIDQVARGFSTSQERLDDLDYRMERMIDEARQARHMARQTSSVIPPPPAGGNDPDAPAEMRGDSPSAAGFPGDRRVDAMPDPEALFNTAYADFSKGNYALAISGFEEFHDSFPDSGQADNALYWVAECHFSQGNFEEAVQGIDQLLELHPNSDRAAAGNLKKALAYLEQNQIGQAIVQLRYVNSKYAGTDEAKIARDKLTSLGAPI